MKGHGACTLVVVNVAEDDVRDDLRGLPIFLNTRIDRPLAIDAPDGELILIPTSRTHEGGNDRDVCHALDDNLSVDVPHHRATSFPVGWHVR